jgi:predicted NBD/HSP70 family sugar kinase
MHDKWERLLEWMAAGQPGVRGAGVSHEMLGNVVRRVALAPGPVARSEISKGSMLLKPSFLASGTVGKAVDGLLGQGLVRELPTRRGQVGPPSTPLALGSSRWAVVGIDVDLQHEDADTLTAVICGLDRKVLAGPEKREVKHIEDDRHDLLGMAGAIRELTESLLTKVPDPDDERGTPDLLGVGVELGGHVHRGVVIDSTHGRWAREVNLGEALCDEFRSVAALRDVPVIVENDVNALAIHGYFERSFDGLDVVLVAVFRRGVGGAMILNGRMYRGVKSMAPEPGHLAVEYPQDSPGWEGRPPPRSDQTMQSFDDECLCSLRERKAYGHVDTLATPARIEGQLAALKPGARITLEEAARAPRAAVTGDPDHLVVTDEAKVMRRAGRALGRGLAHIINIVNPGELVLLLPEALARPAAQSSGTEYLEAAEHAIDDAYSSGPSDARRGHMRLTVQEYADKDLAELGAVAAATTVFNAFTAHARGLDGCNRADKSHGHGH